MAETIHVSKAALLAYCRETEEAWPTLRRLARAAEAYLEESGVRWETSEPALFREAVKSITLNWYDHPELSGTPAGLRQLINQLKLNQRR